jgi:hypothetical protein
VLDVHFVILGAAVGGLGTAVYIRDTLRGVTQPNRVTWLIWATAPLLAFAAEIDAGVGLRSLMTFVSGFFPLLIFVASFVNPRAYWKALPIDYLCGLLAVGGLVLWLITRHGTVAVWASIAADVIAAAPTVRKSWTRPETETAVAYLAGAANAGITLLTVTHLTTSVVAFPISVLAITVVEVVLVGGRIGPRLRVRRAARPAV